MAEAITYADLRFVKAPLKKSNSSRLGHGKDGCCSSLLQDPTPTPQIPILTPPSLSSPDPETEEDGELTYENVPPGTGGPSSLASSRLRGKAGLQPGGCTFVRACVSSWGSP